MARADWSKVARSAVGADRRSVVSAVMTILDFEGGRIGHRGSAWYHGKCMLRRRKKVKEKMSMELWRAKTREKIVYTDKFESSSCCNIRNSLIIYKKTCSKKIIYKKHI